MHRSKGTRNPASTDESSLGAPSEASQRAMLALVVAWAPAEPERVGEVALFEPGSGARILGRGEPVLGAGSERVIFCRQRPGSLAQRPPLASSRLSREQLRIRAEGDRLVIERVGKCHMSIRGERVDGCAMQVGDSLLLHGALLLHCALRPWNMDPLQSASLSIAPEFGAADRHGIVGESPAVWRLRDRLAWVAAADEHTLLLGGSGSGKELCAQSIHALSSRAKGPFVARNAATLPAGLVDAELFGNVKGYPNPGMGARTGLIGAADRGTLFLDEIGELPHALQANLLRVLDARGEYHALGSTAARRSDFRLVCATNRDPSSLKSDFGARLPIVLRVPGLDQRREDIPFLLRHLLQRAAEKSLAATRRFLVDSTDPKAPRPPRIGASLVEHALHAQYTTHVRALHGILWRAMSESPGDTIEWRDAPPDAPSAGEAVEAPGSAPPRLPDPPEEEVRATLETHDGNVTRAAHALGLSSRYVLYRVMRKYGIQARDED